MAIIIYCCQRCPIYWTCETKWYRGERGEADICCANCDYYKGCVRKARENTKTKK